MMVAVSGYTWMPPFASLFRLAARASEGRARVTLDHNFGHVLRFPSERSKRIVILARNDPAGRRRHCPGASSRSCRARDRRGAPLESRTECNVDPRGLVLHADNGKPMRGSTMLATLQWLGVVPSFSRPHVSDDNPYSEALFRTLKHTPAHPHLPFADTVSAQQWVVRFVNWYNGEHRHSAIRYVTPDERHWGREHDILPRRHRLYQRARNAHPERWTGSTRNWAPVGAVLLNPPHGIC